MKRKSALVFAIALLTGGLHARAVGAQHRRPTPREAIERNLAPFTEVLRALQLTEREREHGTDVIERAETTAAEMVEAERHGDHAAVRARTRRMELLSRLLRARIEALRAEQAADEREREVLRAEERRTQAHATLEHATERHLALERVDAVSAFTLPPAEPTAGRRSAPGTP